MPTTKELRQSDPLAGKLTDDLPVIDAELLLDASPNAEREAVQALKRACLDTGFFYVANVFQQSGVDSRVLAQMNTFFSIPGDDPRKQAVNITKSKDDCGWTPLGGELAYQPGTVAHVESYDFGYLDYEGNLWPDLDGFRADITAYWNTLSTLGYAILERLAIAVGLDRGFFVEKCRTEELNTLRLLHYPQNDIGGDDENVGISAHTDFECLSLLYQTAPGLELTDVNGRWYDTPATDGGLFVFIDDMLETWTNGYLKATGHRVRHTNEQRFSTVLFMAVDDDIVIEPLPEFDGVSEPGKYVAVKQEQHIDDEVDRAKANTPE